VGLERPATCSFFSAGSKLGAGVGGAGVGRVGAACGIARATGSLEPMAATTSSAARPRLVR
jgi:hypothetical protein